MSDALRHDATSEGAFTGRMKWSAYLRYLAVDPKETKARRLRKIGGRCPSNTEVLVRRALACGRIDAETYAYLMDAIDELRRRQRDANGFAPKLDEGQWAPLPGGAHARFLMRNADEQPEPEEL